MQFSKTHFTSDAEAKTSRLAKTAICREFSENFIRNGQTSPSFWHFLRTAPAGHLEKELRIHSAEGSSSSNCRTRSEMPIDMFGGYAQGVMNTLATRQQGTNEDPRYRAIVERDRELDGTFYYSVRTTGIYCKPSCASRRPLPQNVEFHRSPQDAERGGYRACKRCKPNEASESDVQASQVEKLCRLIETSDDEPKLEHLARSIGASPSYTQRLFKSAVGITPKKYAEEQRRKRVRETLQTSQSITEAIYASGYGSPARFYSSAKDALGMQPHIYREGGTNEVIRFAIAESSLGPVLVAATKRGICCILLDDDPQFLIDELARRFPSATLTGALPDFDELVAKVVALVQRPAGPFDLPLDIRGTAFQQRVWQALLQIPAGQTANYAEIATRIGQPTAARAVAGACAANHLAVAVPCHRVVRHDGGISGYRWGVERKRKLLERERV